MSALELVFLGTGAAGGTPGKGLSARRESSLLVHDETTSILIDATRDFERQVEGVTSIDALLLTHAHRDASGGISQLRSWWDRRRDPPVRVLAHPDTVKSLEARYRKLDHCRFVPTPPGARRRLGGWTFDAIEVPHAREPRFPTYAWRLRGRRTTVVYASDVANLTPELERFAQRAAVLVVDGADLAPAHFHAPSHRRGPSSPVPLGRRADLPHPDRPLGATAR